MNETAAGSAGETPVTGIEESDPNADSHEGLAGDMGVSSGRRGSVRGGTEQVTYDAAPTYLDDAPDPGEAPSEQSSSDGRPDTNPESPGRHESDPYRNPGHGV